MRPALTVYLKEMKDSLRDRRTLLMVLVASVATGPLALALMAGFISGLEEKAAERKVLMAHAENAPALVNFFERNDVQIETAPEDYEAQVKEGRIDAVIAVSSDFNERYLSGSAAFSSRPEMKPAMSASASGPVATLATSTMSRVRRSRRLSFISFRYTVSAGLMRRPR
jgi:ABC-type Na+ efflux pump permease subunit